MGWRWWHFLFDVFVVGLRFGCWGLAGRAAFGCWWFGWWMREVWE
jgi:hypothetical protein